jgi:hypothetical protein
MSELRRIIADVPKRRVAILEVSQSLVTDLLKGRIDMFTIDALVSTLGRVGARVNIQSRLRRDSHSESTQCSVPERRANNSSESVPRIAAHRNQDSEMSDT